MATLKKKHLIELMIEANVKWPDGANYAAQDKDGPRIHFYRKKPIRGGNTYWSSSERIAYSGVVLQSLCCNWHQTIVTRKQYEQALSSAAATTKMQTEFEHYEPVISQGAYTINQLADDYYTKAVEADRLQATADEALKLANEALITLQKAGEVIGLVISVAPKPEQPNITDWRDLRVGDVIECVLVHGADGVESDESNNKFHGAECRVKGLTDAGINHIETDLKPHGYCIQEFKFIRRP